MNKYIRKLFVMAFQNQQTQQVIHISPQSSPTSPEEWRQYWQAKGFRWRTEPEIDAKRQEVLASHRAIILNVEKGIYPFKGMKLSRADVEWLLATHENGCGPVDWSDESQREREGLDLRGVDLRGENLSSLPLACMYGGLTRSEQARTTVMQQTAAAVHLEGTNLSNVHLEGAQLARAQLEGADLHQAHLEHASLKAAHLEGASLRTAHLESVYLGSAYLNGKVMEDQELEAIRQRKTDFPKYLPPATLRLAFLSTTTNLQNICLGDTKYGFVYAVDVRWGDANLALVDWRSVKRLGEEHQARETKEVNDYREAVRANRQLAVVLQAQGLNEDAARFAYRAQILQRKVLWKQWAFGRWLFSMLLALLAGYGYRMWRILAAYLLVVLLCAVAYFELSTIKAYGPPLSSFFQAVLISITAFHGRVFSEPFTQPGGPQLWVTAFEAVVGLVIEGVFIAMLVQRFFGK